MITYSTKITFLKTGDTTLYIWIIYKFERIKHCVYIINVVAYQMSFPKGSTINVLAYSANISFLTNSPGGATI